MRRRALLALSCCLAAVAVASVATPAATHHESFLEAPPAAGAPLASRSGEDSAIRATLRRLERARHPEAWSGVLDEIARSDSERLRLAVARVQPGGGSRDLAPQRLILPEVVRRDFADEIRAAALGLLAELEALEAFRAVDAAPSQLQVDAFDAERLRHVALALPGALQAGSITRSTALRVLQATPDGIAIPVRELQAIALGEAGRELRMSALECLARDPSDLARGTLLAALADPDEHVSELAEELLDARR